MKTQMNFRTGCGSLASFLAAVLGLWTTASQAANVPLNFSGAQLWLDATDMSTLFQNATFTTPVTTAGQVVRGWRDKSGTNHHVTGSASDTTLVTGVTNLGGQNSVNFSTLTDHLSTSAAGLPIALNQSRTIVMVMDYSLDTGNAEIFGRSTASMIDFGNFDGVQKLRLRSQSESGNARSAPNSVAFGSNLISVTAIGTGGTFAQRNGSALSLVAFSGATDDPSTVGRYQHYAMNDGAVGVGHSQGFASRAYRGNLSEMIVYDRNLNSAELNILHNHLSAKYSGTGVTHRMPLAPAVDFYAGDNDAKGNYDRDVFGIGREADGIVTSKVDSEGLRLAELNSSLAFGEYVLAGNKGGSATPVTTDLPVSGIERWGRTWYLDAEGDVDVSITFDFNAAGISGLFDANGDYALFFQETNAFETSESPFSRVGTLTSVSGGLVTFSVSSLLDGYYTLGVGNVAPVPEPSSFLLLGAGALGMVRQVRRRRSGRV